ncbi:MAG: triose-phosphate isomerase [Planctomycetota bacterium]|nr:MAG: triose-phosphate isomerase [Planctomycetota bacterium]
MRKQVIAGNWKMNGDSGFITELVNGIIKESTDLNNIDIIFIPPAIYASKVIELTVTSNIAVGLQNVYFESKGAYTGETSTEMAKDIGASHILVGHSERRQYYGETNEWVSKKTSCVLNNSLTPIVCLGESLEQRESGKLEEVLGAQLSEGLFHLSADDFSKVIIAYEPVWAIGTGKTASPEQAQEVHAFIRNLIKEKYGDTVSEKIIIQYGGSVNDKNAKELLGQADIDGALVGGASLKVDGFSAILKEANNL